MSFIDDALMGKKVFIVLRDSEILKPVGIKEDKLVAVLKGKEKRAGIWIEVDAVGECDVKSGGKSVKGSRAVVLIPWSNVITIASFPDAKDLNIPSKGKRKIGFRQEQD